MNIGPSASTNPIANLFSMIAAAAVIAGKPRPAMIIADEVKTASAIHGLTTIHCSHGDHGQADCEQ